VGLQALRFFGQNSPVDAKVVRSTADAINPPAEKTVRFAGAKTNDLCLSRCKQRDRRIDAAGSLTTGHPFGAIPPERTKGKRPMSSKPTHTAFVVIDPKEGSDRKATWHEVAALWPHKSGKGFDLVIPEGISLSGRIVILERKDKDQAAP